MERLLDGEAAAPQKWFRVWTAERRNRELIDADERGSTAADIRGYFGTAGLFLSVVSAAVSSALLSAFIRVNQLNFRR